jgi:hypothetical protein
MTANEERADLQRDVQRSQVEPVAGIWACPNCGRRIQVITDSEQPKVQPFTCVCGTPMAPGEEHFEVGHDEATENAETRRVPDARESNR